MKCFSVVLLLLVSASAETPRDGYNGKVGDLDEAPYEASGFRPSIPFNLPSRQVNRAVVTFMAPSREYGQPQQTYGPPPQFGDPRNLAQVQRSYAQPLPERESEEFRRNFGQSQRQYQPTQREYGTPQFDQRNYNQYDQPQRNYNQYDQPQRNYNQNQYNQPQNQYDQPQANNRQNQYDQSQRNNQYERNYNQPQNQYDQSQRNQPQYNQPQPTYTPPEPEYGPPEATEAENEATTTEEAVTTEATTEEQTEQLKDVEEVEEDSGEKQQGVYYIYHPSGVLQKIIFMTKNDLKKMAYSAEFKYEDVVPIKDPIYTYDPKTLQLKQLSE